MGITVHAYTKSIGPVAADVAGGSYETSLITRTAMPDEKADEKALKYLEETRSNYNSAGGVMECIVDGLPAGIGDPVFEKLDANLAKAVMSIGAVKAVEIGDGILVSDRYGSENNDEFRMDGGNVIKSTNHSGGTLGGISDGSPLVIRAHVKPTPSIFTEQHTVDNKGNNIDIKIKGRHDPVIVPRAVVVMECMTALTVLDAMMLNMSARLDSIVNFYKK
jgi:chorismate synthase